MPTKICLNQLKLIRDFVAKFYKKKKFQTSLVINLQYKIEDDKLNTADTSNMKDKFEICFQNNNTNKSNLDAKEEENDNKNKLDMKVKKSNKVRLEVYKQIKWNKKDENTFYEYVKLGQK